jgi:site-specific DNA-methyltransferase (adenine-specific)
MNNNQIILSDNLTALKSLPPSSIRLIYIDPPFNVGKEIKRDRIKVEEVNEGEGDRIGFGGREYKSEKVSSPSFQDSFDDFPAFLMPRIEAALPCLTSDGSLFVHLDYREVHYVKVALDKLLGRDHFIGEIIWASEWGAKSKSKYSMKHNNILWYAIDPKNYVFNYENIDRIPRKAPSLVSKEKADEGKTITAAWENIENEVGSYWWQTVVGTNSKEKCNYPSQKPIKLLERIIKMHSKEGDTVLDFFAGSGTTGDAAGKLKRKFCLIDQNTDAVSIMKERLKAYEPEVIETGNFVLPLKENKELIFTDYRVNYGNNNSSIVVEENVNNNNVVFDELKLDMKANNNE